MAHRSFVLCIVVCTCFRADVIMEIPRMPRDVLKAHGPMKLLHFHENYRPAYYGTWRKCSKQITPRNPYAKDEELLDYEVDSDDEWNEEEPGESLSHSEGEEDDDDNDGFFVPHGHLSDEEGASDEVCLCLTYGVADYVKMDSSPPPFAVVLRELLPYLHGSPSSSRDIIKNVHSERALRTAGLNALPSKRRLKKLIQQNATYRKHECRPPCWLVHDHVLHSLGMSDLQLMNISVHTHHNEVSSTPKITAFLQPVIDSKHVSPPFACPVLVFMCFSYILFPCSMVEVLKLFWPVNSKRFCFQESDVEMPSQTEEESGMVACR
uniref:Uncharacterized protein n=1 Tax=Eptatretus burgeri TaxID=7764 RepID=A0A8C4QQ70_EPTBU